jgi:hypothetical protein
LNGKVAAAVYKTEINGRGNLLRSPSDTLYRQKLTLTSPTSGGRSVDIARLRTKATEFAVFWGVKPCSLADIYQSLGRTHSFHLQGFFYPETDSAFFQNVGIYLPGYTASHPRINSRHSNRFENFKSHGDFFFAATSRSTLGVP